MAISIITYLIAGFLSYCSRVLFNIDISLLFIFLIIMGSFASILKEGKENKAVLILFLGFLIRIMIIYAEYNGVIIFSSRYGDIAGYEEAALARYSGGISYFDNSFSTLVAYAIYGLWGVNIEVVKLTNTLFWLWSSFFVLRTTRVLNYSLNAQRIALLIATFLPNSLMVSTVFIRESIIVCLASGALYFHVNWMEGEFGKLKYLVAGVSFGLIAAIFHSGMIVIVIAMAISYLFYNRQKKEYIFGERTIARMIPIAVVAAIIIVKMGKLLIAKFGGGIDISSMFARVAFLESQESNTTYYATVRTGVMAIDLIATTVLRGLYINLAPMVWDLTSVSKIGVFLFDGVFYLLLAMKLIKNVMNKKEYKRKDIVTFILMIVALEAIMFGWGTANAATAMRHRGKFIGIWAVFLGLIISESKGFEYEQNEYIN